MDTYFFDWETLYTSEYTLSKMDPPSYILDPMFEAICLGVAKNADPAFIVDGPDIPDFLKRMPRDVAVVSHNQLFDACIGSWRYNYVPKLIIDTLAMSRTLLGHLLKSNSLRSVARHLGLPEKGDIIQSVKGMTRADIIACEMWEQYTAYCLNDVELCRMIYLQLAPLLPDEEFIVHDMIARCAVEPRFRLNTEVLQQHLGIVRAEKNLSYAYAQQAGVTSEEQLRSNPQFAQVLRNLGIDPPLKISPTTDKVTYAFSKTDVEFMELLDHEDPRVRAVMEARLGHKTSLEETRTERMLNIANLDFPHHGGTDVMPIPLKVGAAITHRFGGDWKLNCMHPDAQLLTPHGWQRIADWKPTIPIMQWWPGGKLSWEEAPQKIERDDTQLVQFSHRHVEGLFTPDHRMVNVSRNGIVSVRRAGDDGEFRIPLVGLFEDGGSPFTADQIRLLAALAADGSQLYKLGPRPQRKSIPSKGWQFGFRKQRKIDRMRWLLSVNGIVYNEWTDGRTTQFVIRETNTPPWLIKGFGPWVLKLSPDVASALLDEVVHWDGHPNHRSGETEFYSSLRDQAEWVWTLARLHGRPASLFVYGRRFVVYFKRSAYARVLPTERNLVDYQSRTYCPSVTSSYVLVRWRDTIYVTGQCQNWGRQSPIRRSVEAPDGYTIVACDAAQIEARLTAWFCGQQDLVDQFARGEDVYAIFATDLFGYPVNKREHPGPRFIGKTGILQLGYQSWWPKFQRTVRLLSEKEVGYSIELSDEDAEKYVTGYRNRYWAIRDKWGHLGLMIPWMANADEDQMHVMGPVTFHREMITGPNGLKLYYRNLTNDPGTREWTYTYGDRLYKLYGGKVLENIIQFLARVATMQAALRIRKQCSQPCGLTVHLAHQAHDELVYLCRNDDVKDLIPIVTREMSRTPDWAPGLPLRGETKVGYSYGEMTQL
jgi:hypothetical protein